MKYLFYKHGFTLLELLTTLFIASILISIANFSISNFYNSQTLKNTAKNLSVSLRKAYLLAINNKTNITILPINSWDKGWVAFEDTNYNFKLDKNENVIDKFINSNANIILAKSNIECIIFNQVGLTRQCGNKNGLLVNGTISFKHSSSNKCENNINLIFYRNKSRICEASKKNKENCECK